jgi:very-short-patch-repair endonuclease
MSICSNHRICICDSIYSTHPELCQQFITEKDRETFKNLFFNFNIVDKRNGNKICWIMKQFNIDEIIEHNKHFDLKQIKIGSNKIPKIGQIKGVFWKCTNENLNCKHHVWDAKFIDRKNSPGCPFCSKPSQRICPCKSVVSQTYFKEFDDKHPENPSIELLQNISKGSDLKLWWKCETCNRSWKTSCNSRTKGMSCSLCSGYFKHSTQDIIQKMKKYVMDNNFDYSKFQYTGPLDKSIIICKKHNQEFLSSYNGHIKNTAGCSECKIETKQNSIDKYRNKFLINTKKLYEDLYDYKEFVYINTLTPGKIFCNLCKFFFIKTPEHHINRREGCPNCIKSYGEILISCILKKMNLPFICEYKIKSIPQLENKRFDFMINYNNKNILLEYDGRQHFIYIPLIHQSEDKFKIRQEIDRMKTQLSIKNGFYIIRISYLEEKNIYSHIIKALDSLSENKKYYFSNIQLYRNMLEN